MQRKLRNKGFTLIELLLTMGIMCVIMAAIYQSTSYGMGVFRRVNRTINTEAIGIMKQLSRQLRSSFLISNKTPSIIFSGTASSLRFVATAPLGEGYDLKQYRYFLRRSEQDGTVALIHTEKDILPLNGQRGEIAEDNNGQRLSVSVKTMVFSYFDGNEWKPSWASNVQLPQSVRISIQFQTGENLSPLEYYSTVVRIPGA